MNSEQPPTHEATCKYPIVEKSIQSFDGTSIGYYTAGRDLDENGPSNMRRRPRTAASRRMGEGPDVIVISNGLGGNWFAWKYFIEYFGDRFRLIIWDYRGLYRSARPADLRTLSVDNQCRDLAIILEKERVTKAVFAGWSMGVQVNFEFYRTHPELFQAIVAFCGVDGKPFDSLFNSVRLRAQVPRFITLLERMGGPQKRLMDWFLQKPWGFTAMKKVGMIGATCSEEVFSVVSREFANMDFEVYYRTLGYLGKHDASDLLKRIHKPVLVVFGDKDSMTPVSRAVRMDKNLPNSELMIIPSGTHYLPIEFPDWVNLRVEKFLASRGLLPK